MAHFGHFAPCGLLTFGAQEPASKAIYDTLIDAQKAAFDVSEGTHVEATCYARALALASVRASLDHANAQRHPIKAVELLEEHEERFGVVPAPGQSDDSRRRAVAARKVLTQGSRISALSMALRRLLGSGFVALRTTKPSELAVWPSSPGDVGAWADPAAPSKVFRLVRPIMYPGTAITFQYEPVADDSRLVAGDRVTLQAENDALAEAVTILSVDSSVTPLEATATVANAHDEHASIATYAPILRSNQRHFIVVVTSAVANDIAKRRSIHDLMARAVRGSTRWHIVNESAPGTLGPYTIGVTPLGTATIGTIAT